MFSQNVVFLWSQQNQICTLKRLKPLGFTKFKMKNKVVAIKRKVTYCLQTAFLIVFDVSK
jgi:hypothetical protein